MKSKSHQVFSAFSPQECKDLQSFIRFNNPLRSKSLLKLISTYRKSEKNPSLLSKEQIFYSIFPESHFSDVKLRLLQSELQKVMEEFIMWKALKEDSITQKKVLFDFYKERSLGKTFSKQLNASLKSSNQKLHLDIELLEERMILAEEVYNFAIQQRKEAIEETKALIDKLDHYFIVKKLQLSCLVASQENVYNLEFEHGLRDDIVEHVEKNNLVDYPLIGIYYYCFKMLSTPHVDIYFDKFYAHLEEYGSQFSHGENTQLYTLAINFCIRALNQGKKAFGHQGLNLYQSSLDRGILLNNGKISKFTFRNIITMAIRIGEFELAESYIEKYRSLLHKNDMVDMVHFTSSLVLFSKGDYDLARDELLNVHFKDLLFNLAAKGLMLKIYYEQKEILLLQSHLDAMQIFLKRHKAVGYHRQNYLNIISYTRKLINAKTREKLLNLKSAIKEESILTERRWFLEKINLHSLNKA